MKQKNQKERKFFIKEDLYLIPVLGIILGIFVLPFLQKGRLESYIISIYAIISAIYTYINELVDCYKETQRYKGLPDEIKENLTLRHWIAPACYISLSFIFLPIILFSFSNYWTNYSLHWSS